MRPAVGRLRPCAPRLWLSYGLFFIIMRTRVNADKLPNSNAVFSEVISVRYAMHEETHSTHVQFQMSVVRESVRANVAGICMLGIPASCCVCEFPEFSLYH